MACVALIGALGLSLPLSTPALAAATCRLATINASTSSSSAYAPTSLNTVEEAYNCLLDEYGGATTDSPAGLAQAAWQSATVAAGEAVTPLPLAGGSQAEAFASLANKLSPLVLSETPAQQTSILHAAISGMASSLNDDHTIYLSRAVFLQEMASLSSQPILTIGAMFSADAAQQHVFIDSVVPGSPAAQAGLHAGDVLLAVNGHQIAPYVQASCQGASTVAGSLTHAPWPEGPVSLQFLNAATGQPITTTVTAQSLAFPDVQGGLVVAGVGYVRIWIFSAGTAGEALALVQSEMKQGAKRIVLDVRDNPGGSLEDARDIVSAFTQRNPLALVRDRMGTIGLAPNSAVPRLKVPVSVIVDGGSASAAEFLAAALQDAGAAVIVGTHTAGEIGAAEIFQLDDGSGLEITEAQFLRADGRSLDGIGVQPDLVVADSPAALEQGRDLPLLAAETGSLPVPQSAFAIGTVVTSPSGCARLWSGYDAKAIAFGMAPEGDQFVVLSAAHNGRQYVYDLRTKAYAWIDAALVQGAAA